MSMTAESKAMHREIRSLTAAIRWNNFLAIFKPAKGAHRA